MHYIGLDVHKQSIAFCVKTGDGTVIDRGTLEATRPAASSAYQLARIFIRLGVRHTARPFLSWMSPNSTELWSPNSGTLDR